MPINERTRLILYLSKKTGPDDEKRVMNRLRLEMHLHMFTVNWIQIIFNHRYNFIKVIDGSIVGNFW